MCWCAISHLTNNLFTQIIHKNLDIKKKLLMSSTCPATLKVSISYSKTLNPCQFSMGYPETPKLRFWLLAQTATKIARPQDYAEKKRRASQQNSWTSETETYVNHFFTFPAFLHCACLLAPSKMRISFCVKAPQKSKRVNTPNPLWSDTAKSDLQVFKFKKSRWVNSKSSTHSSNQPRLHPNLSRNQVLLWRLRGSR